MARAYKMAIGSCTGVTWVPHELAVGTGDSVAEDGFQKLAQLMLFCTITGTQEHGTCQLSSACASGCAYTKFWMLCILLCMCCEVRPVTNSPIWLQLPAGDQDSRRFLSVAALMQSCLHAKQLQLEGAKQPCAALTLRRIA